MKILAISDWHTQSIQMLEQIINENHPDAILFAGDGLERIAPLGNSLMMRIVDSYYLQNENSRIFSKLTYPDLRYENNGNCVFDEKSEIIIKNYLEKNSPKLSVPFYCVNGNEDHILQIHDANYIKKVEEGFIADRDRFTIQRSILGKFEALPLRHFIDDDKESNTDQLKDLEDLVPIDPSSREQVEKLKKTGNYLMIKNEDGKLLALESLESFLSTQVEQGIFSSINLNYDEFEITEKNDSVSVFGFKCQQGLLESDTLNEPTKQADIFLSHIPPRGILDLTSAVDIVHTGSELLLNAIKAYEPKILICGHVHVWGGYRKRIGNTLVVNVSSPSRDPATGNYAIIDTEDWSCKIKQITYFNPKKIRGYKTLCSNVSKKRISLMENSNGEEGEDILLDKRISELYLELLKCPIGPIDEVFRWLRSKIDKVKNQGVTTKTFDARLNSKLEGIAPVVLRRITIDPDKYAFVDVETGLFKSDSSIFQMLFQTNSPVQTSLRITLCYGGKISRYKHPKDKTKFIAYLKQQKLISTLELPNLESWSEEIMHLRNPDLDEDEIEIEFEDEEPRPKEVLKPWLIGLSFKGEFMQFLFPTQKEQFLDYIRQKGIRSMASWTQYDKRVLEPIFDDAKVKIKFADACQRTSNCVIWHSYDVHSLYNAFFPQKVTEDLIHGYSAGLYADHIIIPEKECLYCPPRKELMEQIKIRNRTDVLQMDELCRFLRK